MASRTPAIAERRDASGGGRGPTGRVRLGAVLLAAAAATSCQSAAVETTTRQMDSGIGLALSCAVGTRAADGTTTWAGATMDHCAKSGDGDLFAFVIQRTRGELSAVDLRTKRILDLDLRQPLASPVTIGPLPNAIAASPDGSRLVVANLGQPLPGEDPTNPDGLPFLTVVDPAHILPQLDLDNLPERVYLPSPAAAAVFLDSTHVVVAMPKLSALAVVTLGTPSTVGAPLALEPFPLLDPEGNPLPGMSEPWSLLVDPGRGRLLVGDEQAARLAVLGWDDSFNLTVQNAVDLDGPAIRMAIEPIPAGATAGRWIYAVDGYHRGVMVLDAEDLHILDLATEDPTWWRREITVDGLAQDVVIGNIVEDPAPTSGDPSLLHGVFGFIVSSLGEVYAVDIEDHADTSCWSGTAAGDGDYLDDEAHCPRHVLRNAVAAKNDTGPQWSELPMLSRVNEAGDVVGQTVNDPPGPERPYFAGWGSSLDPETDRTYGVFFDPDRRRAVSQSWRMEYQGIIPYTDGVGGEVKAGGEFDDRAMGFCDRGVLAGDILEILDGPNPLDEDTNCSAWGQVGRTQTTPLRYRISDAHSNVLQLEEIPKPHGTEGEVLALLPDPDCFPFAVEYRVRVGGAWLVTGSSTGFQHHVRADADGRCVNSPDDAACPTLDDCATLPDGYDYNCLHSGRAVEGVVYRNPYICFTMLSGTDGSDELRWELTATGGFSPLVVATGLLPVAAAVDTTSGTGQALLVVDSSSNGLIRVDLDGFTETDNWP